MLWPASCNLKSQHKPTIESGKHTDVDVEAAKNRADRWVILNQVELITSHEDVVLRILESVTISRRHTRNRHEPFRQRVRFQLTRAPVRVRSRR